MEDEKNYYHAEDFEIGKTVDIAGRSILIHDCDGFTKKFFKTNYDKGTDYSVMMIMNSFFLVSQKHVCIIIYSMILSSLSHGATPT